MLSPMYVFSAVPTYVFRTMVGLAFCLLSCASLAAPTETHQMDIFSTQLTALPAAPSNTTNTTANGLIFGKVPRLPNFADFKKGASWISSIRWHLSDEGSHASLSPHLRFESKDSRIEIRPTQNSFSITWRKSLQ